MQMMWLEVRKVMIQQKALIWILLFLVCKAVGMWYGFETEGIDSVYKETYREYLEKLGGRLDEEKSEFIVSRYHDLQGVARAVNDLEEQYEQGNLSKEDYQESLSAVAQLKQEQEVIVLLFLIAVPVFCMEYETEMSHLQLCSRKGSVQLTVFKIVMTGILAAVISLMFCGIGFCFYKYTGGLLYETAPLQSLTFFEESSYYISLIQLWILITVSKMAGAVFLSLMIMAVSVLLRKSLLVIIVNGLLVLVPVVFSAAQKIKYMLPLPVGLLYGTGYFFPSLYEYQFEPELGVVEKYVSFEAFTQGDLYKLALVYLIAMVLLVCVIMGRHLGVRLRIRKTVAPIAMVICISTCLSGCSQNTVEDEV